MAQRFGPDGVTRRDPDPRQMARAIANGPGFLNHAYDDLVLADGAIVYLPGAEVTGATSGENRAPGGQISTIVGSPSFDHIVGPFPSDLKGATLLNGTTQYVTIPKPPIWTPSGGGPARTVIIWFAKRVGSATATMELAIEDPAAGSGFNLQLFDGGSGHYIEWYAQGFGQSVHSGQTVTDTLWHMAAATYDGAATPVWKILVDAVDATVLETSPSTITDDGAIINIGRRQDASRFFDGRWGRFSIHPSVLTNQQILDLYNTGLGITATPPFVNEWGFDEAIALWVPGWEEPQAWSPQPPAAAVFDPAAGFPWNQDQGELFVQGQFWPDGTIPPFVGIPINADSLDAFNGDSEVTQFVPAVDDTPNQPGYPLGVVQLTWWPGDPEPPVQLPTNDDITFQSVVPTPPINAAALSAFNGDPDVVTLPTSSDETIQSWDPQPPAITAFDPSTGFPWTSPQGEEFVVPQIAGEPDSSTEFNFDAFDPSTVPWTGRDDIVQPQWSVVDDTRQAYAIQPPAGGVAFNPANGFPWNQDQGERFMQVPWTVVPEPMVTKVNFTPPSLVLAGPPVLIDIETGDTWLYLGSVFIVRSS